MKNTVESIGNRADHLELGISKLEDRNLETIPIKEERELRSFKNKKILQELSQLFQEEQQRNGYPRRKRKEEGRR